MYQVYHHFSLAKKTNLMIKSAFDSITNRIAFKYQKNVVLMNVANLADIYPIHT